MWKMKKSGAEQGKASCSAPIRPMILRDNGSRNTNHRNASRTRKSPIFMGFPLKIIAFHALRRFLV
jgi:hypothetical protein